MPPCLAIPAWASRARAVDPNDLRLRQGGGANAITLELPKELVKRRRGERYRFVRGWVSRRAAGFDHETLWLCDDIARIPMRNLLLPHVSA